MKQFIKYGNYLNDVGYGGRLTIKKWVQEKCGISTAKQRAETNADLITEDIFSEFEQSGNKSDADPKSKYGLMKLSDDLAKGKFRTQGGSKKGLYYLAMVLDMNIAGFPGVNKENDIIKNLFKDYYTNNLMRYMTDAYIGHTREYESPSGQGVNFKNFAEMVFLYYIAKRDMKAEEKLRLSKTMIEELSQIAGSNLSKIEKVKKERKVVFLLLKTSYK